MYVKFTPPSSQVGGLVDYLSKEDDLLEKQRAIILKSKNKKIKKCVDYLSKEIENAAEDDNFFTNASDNVDANTVAFQIEHNCKGLKLNENRFFMANINPSMEEIEHIQRGVEQFCRKNNIEAQKDKEAILRQHLKEFSGDVMDQYAQNFGREGVDCGQDLVWYGKVEKHRYWKHDAKEVIENNILFKQIETLEKNGVETDLINELRGELNKDLDQVIYSNMPKSGCNWHVHIVISRKDATQKKSLSPLSKCQNSQNHIVNGKPCKSGFSRVQFAKRVEAAFDKKFDYVRPYHQTIDARLEFAKIKTENVRINRAANKLHVGNVELVKNWMVRSNQIIPEINTLIEAQKAKQRLVNYVKIAQVQYDIKNKIWERKNPKTTRPYQLTEKGQLQLIEIKYLKRLGLDVSVANRHYFRDMDSYNRLHSIEKQSDYYVQIKYGLSPNVANCMSVIGKSMGNNLFKELHFNDVSKVVRLSYEIMKTVYKTQKIAVCKANIKAERWQENSARVVVQNTKTVAVMQKQIAKTVTNNITVGVDFAHTPAQQATNRALEKIGKGVAIKALRCVNPVLSPIRVISMATGVIKGLISNDMTHDRG